MKVLVECALSPTYKLSSTPRQFNLASVETRVNWVFLSTIPGLFLQLLVKLNPPRLPSYQKLESGRLTDRKSAGRYIPPLAKGKDEDL